MDADDDEMLELYEKLKREFQYVSYLGSFITVSINKTLWVSFYKSSKNHDHSYDMLRNYNVLEEFLVFHGFKYINIRDYAHFYMEDINISVNSSYTELSIIPYGESHKIDKYFDKIYNLIDYLKDYFKIQNKVAFEE